MAASHGDSARQRWVASITVGYTASGQRIFKRARGRTKTEAQRKLKEIIRDYEDGLVIGGYGYTVAGCVFLRGVSLRGVSVMR